MLKWEGIEDTAVSSPLMWLYREMGKESEQWITLRKANCHDFYMFHNIELPLKAMSRAKKVIEK